MDADILKNNNKNKPNQVPMKRCNTSDTREKKIQDTKQYKRSKNDNGTILKDNSQRRASRSQTCNGHEDVLKENTPCRAVIHSNLERVDRDMKLLDEKLNSFSVSTSISYNNDLFIFLNPERDVIRISKNIQEILSDNFSNSTVNPSNKFPVNTDIQDNENNCNETEKDILTSQRPIAADEINTETMDNNSEKEYQNRIEFDRMDLDDIISLYIPSPSAKQDNDPSENTPVSHENTKSKKNPTRTEDLDEVPCEDFLEDAVMAPPQTNLKNIKSPRNCSVFPTPPSHKQDDEISLYVQTPLREEFDTEYNIPKIYTSIFNNNKKIDKIQQNDKQQIKQLEINAFVNIADIKSVIFKFTCARYARGQCRYNKCLLRHTWPDIENVKSELERATRRQLIDEYNVAQKMYYAKKRYTTCFVEECIRRQETRILLEITFDVIKRRWFERDPIKDDVLYASLSQLHNTDFNDVEDILLLAENKIIFHDELIFAIIRSDYAELSTYETLLQKLIDFVLKNKSILYINIAKKLLYKLIDAETLSTRMAKIATTVFCKTNPSIFRVHEMTIFKANLKRKHSELFDIFCREEDKILHDR